MTVSLKHENCLGCEEKFWGGANGRYTGGERRGPEVEVRRIFEKRKNRYSWAMSCERSHIRKITTETQMSEWWFTSS